MSVSWMRVAVPGAADCHLGIVTHLLRVPMTDICQQNTDTT